MPISVGTVLAGLLVVGALVWTASMLLSDVHIDQEFSRGSVCSSTFGVAVNGAITGGEPMPDDEAYEAACRDAAKTQALIASAPAIVAVAAFAYFGIGVRRDHQASRFRSEQRLRAAGITDL